jgi:hypothetical protein
VRVRCDVNLGVQVIFDMRGTASEDAVTIRAGGTTWRNFRTRVVGRTRAGQTLREVTYARRSRFAIPFGDYHTITIAVHQGTEARAIDATARAVFVAGMFKAGSGPRLYGCYVRRWSSRVEVRPF